MRKNIFGKRLSRDKNQRQALFKSLISSLIIYGRIKTTSAKASAIKGLVDRLVNAAREATSAKRRFILSFLPKVAAEKLINEIAPRFSQRTSGFTRVLKVGPRFTDNAAMVVMEWVENIEDGKMKTEDRKKKIKAKEKLGRKAKPKSKRVIKTKTKTKPKSSSKKGLKK